MGPDEEKQEDEKLFDEVEEEEEGEGVNFYQSQDQSELILGKFVYKITRNQRSPRC